MHTCIPTHAHTLTRRRATVNAECITAYNELKLNKKYKYVIFKLTDDNKEIVVESTSEDGPEYEDFRKKLINATTKSKTVGRNRQSSMTNLMFNPLTATGRHRQGAPLCRLRRPVRARLGRGHSVGCSDLTTRRWAALTPHSNKITFLSWSPDDAGIMVRPLLPPTSLDYPHTN